jgi:hypothetical protein
VKLREVEGYEARDSVVVFSLHHEFISAELKWKIGTNGPIFNLRRLPQTSLLPKDAYAGN